MADYLRSLSQLALRLDLGRPRGSPASLGYISLAKLMRGSPARGLVLVRLYLTRTRLSVPTIQFLLASMPHHGGWMEAEPWLGWRPPGERCGQRGRRKIGERGRRLGKKDLTCRVHMSVSIACNPGRHHRIPGAPNMSRVQTRPGLTSSGYDRPGFGVQGLICLTSMSLKFRMDFFLY